MSSQLLIEEGGVSLHGKYQLSPNIRIAYRALFLALLSSETVLIKNVVRSQLLNEAVELVQFLGGRIEWKSDTEIVVGPDELTTIAVPRKMYSKENDAFFLLGLLCGRYHEAAVETTIKLPDLPDLDFETKRNGSFVTGLLGSGDVQMSYRLGRIYPAELLGLIAMATLREGQHTVFKDVELDLEVRTLIKMLNRMGAKIEIVDSTRIEIEGVLRLEGAEFSVPASVDEVTIVSVLAILTQGEVEIVDINKDGLVPFLAKLDQSEVQYQVNGDSLHIWSNRLDDLKPVDVKAGLYPGFLSEWTGPISVLMTQANGESSISTSEIGTEISYVDVLKAVGSEVSSVGDAEEKIAIGIGSEDRRYKNMIEYPQTLRVFGPTKLHGGSFKDLDVPSSIVALVASLVAKGFSEIYGVERIESFYPGMIEKLIGLGAKIKQVEV